jgi:hypothetical protein
VRFDPNEEEKERKRRAIRCHATQLTVHRRKFLSATERPEVFYPGEAAPEADGLHPVRRVRLDPGVLRLDLVLRPRLGAFGRPTLRLAAARPGQGPSLSFDLRWRRGDAEVKDLLTHTTRGLAALRGDRRGGTVEVPVQALPGPGTIYVKLERRFGFFDEGGWLEIQDPSRGDA